MSAAQSGASALHSCFSAAGAAAAAAATSAAVSFGISRRYSGRRSVILRRSVRAPTSCLSLATHTGTTLCASTSISGVAGSAAATASFQPRGARSGEKSVTIARTP